MEPRGGNEDPLKGAAVDDDSEAPFSVGHYLKAQRVLRGIELEELSLRTRIPRRSLERLEAGAFDGEPDGFVRGFVRTVSDGLGLDADDTLMRMLREPEASRRHVAFGLPPRAWFVLGGLAAALVALLGLAQIALRAGPELDELAADEVVRRQDPVRALAEAQAASPPIPASREPALRHRAEPVAPPVPVRSGEPGAETPGATAAAADLPAVSSRPGAR